jgi:hypothetical protein
MLKSCERQTHYPKDNSDYIDEEEKAHANPRARLPLCLLLQGEIRPEGCQAGGGQMDIERWRGR